MKMLIIIVCLPLFFGTFASVASQPFADYYTQNQYLLTSPGASHIGLTGYTNPAMLSTLHAFETQFAWTTDGDKIGSLQNWGLLTGVRGLGFGLERYTVQGHCFTDYRLGSAFGDEGFAFGVAYGWSSANGDAIGRGKMVSAGLLMRPSRFLSTGMIGQFSLKSSQREYVAEIGARPFGSDGLTLFADAAWEKESRFSDAPWSVGVFAKVAPGVFLSGRYFDSKAMTVGITFDMGRSSLASQANFDTHQDYANNTHVLRLGGFRNNLFTQLAKDKSYLDLSLKGRVDYLKYRFGDEDAHPFLELLENIRHAARDARVAVIVINLSSARITPEHAWEIRQELSRFRNSGKKVVAFVDVVGMTTYHLASAADLVVIDPQGMALMQGFALGNTYFKGTLEKMGLGFDEWRFFKYKSAMESYSREDMSEAEREQSQDFVDDWYELVRQDVCESRHITYAAYDSIINEKALFRPEEFVAAGLADTTGRWSDREAILEKLAGRKLAKMPAGELLANARPQTDWGNRPQIAVIYALGVCAMDEGIRARWLENQIDGVRKSARVKAVVFRVDSPGGDGMASDVVAEALRKCREEKPVIVSQGQVAGSGGYWISMYGDTILAGPNTVTGSIGVIGGWIYDKGFGQHLGMTSDYVQRGHFADAMVGVRLPLFGLEVPHRNLTPQERKIVENHIKGIYQQFLGKVAGARKMSLQRVDEIGQGHFYSGLVGRNIGLVDEIGGLTDALALARRKAGLAADEQVDILEIPKTKGLINLDFLPSYARIKTEDDPVIQYIKMLTERPGKPLFMLLPGTVPE
jgi:protease-4